MCACVRACASIGGGVRYDAVTGEAVDRVVILQDPYPLRTAAAARGGGARGGGATRLDLHDPIDRYS